MLDVMKQVTSYEKKQHVFKWNILTTASVSHHNQNKEIMCKEARYKSYNEIPAA